MLSATGCFGELWQRWSFFEQNEPLHVDDYAVCVYSQQQGSMRCNHSKLPLVWLCCRVSDVQITGVIRPGCCFGGNERTGKNQAVCLCACLYTCVHVCANSPNALSFESLHSRAMGSHSLECAVMNSAALRELSAFFLIINDIFVSLKVSEGSYCDVRYEAADFISTLSLHQHKQIQFYIPFSNLILCFILSDHRGWMLSLFCSFHHFLHFFPLVFVSWVFFFFFKARVGRRTLAAMEFSGAAYPCQKISSPSRSFPQRRCDKVSARGLARHSQMKKEKQAGWSGGLAEGRGCIDWDKRQKKENKPIFALYTEDYDNCRRPFCLVVTVNSLNIFLF